MASRRRAKNTVTNKSAKSDTDSVDKLSSSQLRDSLKSKGINVPTTLTKTVLKSLYRENCVNASASTSDNTTDSQKSRSRSRSPIEKHDNSDNAGVTECLKTLGVTMTAFTETVRNLSRASSNQFALPTVQHTTDYPTLSDVYANATISSDTPGTYEPIGLDRVRHLAAQSMNGVPAQMLQNIDIVSDSLKKQITDGRNVNLASLLIQDFEQATSAKDPSHDSRLKKRLTIEQFRIAFGKYRRVMVAKWPHRRQELEAYETDIGRIHSFYGDKFYDYHLAFASKAAEAVKLSIPVDWSRRDGDLFQLILGGTRAKQCSHCSSTLHDTDFCEQTFSLNTPISNRFPNSPPQTRPKRQGVDKYGRQIKHYKGIELCNNYNSNDGCTRAFCKRYHGCAFCMAENHAVSKCPKMARRTKPDNVFRGLRNPKA